MVVKVIFDYEAVEADELTLDVGDIITNVIKEDGGWWRGDLKGRNGVFPDNFVTVIDDTVKTTSSDAVGSSSRKATASLKAIVKFDYEQEHPKPDELKLKEGM